MSKKIFNKDKILMEIEEKLTKEGAIFKKRILNISNRDKITNKNNNYCNKIIKKKIKNNETFNETEIPLNTLRKKNLYYKKLNIHTPRIYLDLAEKQNNIRYNGHISPRIPKIIFQNGDIPKYSGKNLSLYNNKVTNCEKKFNYKRYNKIIINNIFEMNKDKENDINFININNDSKPNNKAKNKIKNKTKNDEIPKNKNSKYSNALKNIFQKPEYFLNNYYKGNKVIVGKKYNKIKGIKELFEYCLRRRKRRKTVNDKSTMQSLSVFQKSLRRKRIISSKRRETSFESSSYEETNKTICVSPNENEVKNIPISDNDLKLLYKHFELREEKNKENRIKYRSSNNFFNKSTPFGINKMLNLQEKILEINKKKDKIAQKIVNKIMNVTSKQKDKILMTGLKNNFIIKSKSMDKEIHRFNAFFPNFNDMMRKWIYNLRKSNKEVEESKKNSEEIICLNKNLTLFRNKSELNMRNKLYEKFNINDKMNKTERKSMNLFDINKSKNNLRSNNNINNNNNFINNNSINLSSFHNLFIQGKNLLNQEIRLSKELFGKKKFLFQYNFVPDEISSILMAKSNTMKNINKPKAVINSMQIHKFF